MEIKTLLKVWNAYDVYAPAGKRKEPLMVSSVQKDGFFYELVCAYFFFIDIFENEGVWADYPYVFNKGGWEYECFLSEDKKHLLIKNNH